MLRPIVESCLPSLYRQYSLNCSPDANSAYNWILQYLCMQSTTEGALAFYQSLLSSPQLLAQGYSLVRDFLFASADNRSQTLLALLHPQVPVLTLVLNIYPTELFSSPQILPEEKQQTRQFLANLLVSELLKSDSSFNERAVSLLFSFLHKIHNVEGFSEWVLLYEQALERLVENQSGKFGLFLLGVLREADDRVGEFSRHVLGLVVGSTWVPSPQQQLEIVYFCFKSLAVLNDTDPQTIQTYVSQHIQPTISYLAQYMKTSVRTMKFSLKILTILLGDYQVPCSKELLREIEGTGAALIVEYINYLNRGCSSVNTDVELQEEEGEGDPLQIALYQLLQLFLTLYGNEVKISSELSVYLCITSTFLSQQQMRRYLSHSDQYLMDVEDEGEASLRNKSLFFISEMMENEKQNKKCKKMLVQYIQEILTNMAETGTKMSQFLSAYQLPSALLSLPHLYVQSALLILYSFTDQLAQNEKQFSAILGSNIQNSPPNSIQAVLSVTVLTKLLRKQPASGKSEYLSFLRNMVNKFGQNVGMLIAIMRGFYTFSPQEELIISENGKTVPLILVQRLLTYLSGNDSAQRQSAYLILQFLLHLLKREENRTILQQLISSESQLFLLRTYVNDGITSPLIIDLIAALSNQVTLSAIFAQIVNGYAVDQNLAALIGKCIRNKSINLTEDQLLELCKIYLKRLEVISDIIVAYLDEIAPQNQRLVELLNNQLSSRWLPHLIRYDRLFNLKETLLACIKNIVHNITSPSQLESQLVLPFSLILRSPQQTIQLLTQEQVFLPFMSKLLDYAKLFKGDHLKITTVNVFALISASHRQWIAKTLQLYDGYGAIESNEWEDEEEEDRIINKYFSGIVNEEVEKTFKTVFGELAWDSTMLQARIAQLRQMM